MLHTYIRRFNVMGTVQIFLGTTHDKANTRIDVRAIMEQLDFLTKVQQLAAEGGKGEWKRYYCFPTLQILAQYVRAC